MVPPPGYDPGSNVLQTFVITISTKVAGGSYEDRTHTMGTTNPGAGHYTNDPICMVPCERIELSYLPCKSSILPLNQQGSKKVTDDLSYYTPSVMGRLDAASGLEPLTSEGMNLVSCRCSILR